MANRQQLADRKPVSRLMTGSPGDPPYI